MSELKETAVGRRESQQQPERDSFEAQDRLDDIADCGSNEKPNRVEHSRENAETRQSFAKSPDAAQARLYEIADDPHPEISQVEPVNGRMPLNYEYAGKTYPVEKLPPQLQDKYPDSVKLNEKAFVDFSPYAKAEVDIELTGNRAHDFKLANKAAGFDKTPEGYTWHHHENAKTMQLVPTDIHDEVKHTGGCATSGLDYNKRK